MVASAEAIYRFEAVLGTPPDSPCIPVLARGVELAVGY